MHRREHSTAPFWTVGPSHLRGGNPDQLRAGAARNLRRERRSRPHGCWDHLIVAPLWVRGPLVLGQQASPPHKHPPSYLSHGDLP
jgi:hypothetical protein